MADAQISAQEQLVLELINRARLDPLGEAARYGISLNQGLDPERLTAAPKQPLAWNTDLSQAAAGHSEWLMENDVFSHSGAGGSSPRQRMSEAGYIFTGSSASGENVSLQGSTASIALTATAYAHHEALVRSAGHRVNILGDYREIGLGQEVGRFSQGSSTFNASILTETFARTGTTHFITGVAYDDADKDRSYDVGEGRDRVVFDWHGNAGAAAVSAGAGGYALALPTQQTGFHDVTVRTPTDTMRVSVNLSTGSVKLDLVGSTLASSASMTLEAGAERGRLLGAGHLDLQGNAAANILDGNKGNNLLHGQGANDRLSGWGGADRLDGGAGSDRLEGGAGDDTLRGGAGSDRFIFRDRAGATTGTDRIEDLAPGDRIQIDLRGPLPAEVRWEDSHLAATADGWRITLDDGSAILIDGGLSRAQVEAAIDLL